MQITDADLTVLLDGLADCLTVGHPATEPFDLGQRNLSVLYRHARLARALRLTVKDLLDTVALTEQIVSKPTEAERCILTLADLHAVVNFHEWRIGSGFSIPEIQFITGSASTLPGYDAADSVAARLATEVAGERSLEIASDVFTQIGLTQAQSAAVVGANVQAAGGPAALLGLIPGADVYRVVPTVGLTDVGNLLVFDPDVAPAMIADFARELYAIVLRAGDAGFEPSDLDVLGLSEQQAAELIQANVSLGAADARPFEALPGTAGHYRLRAAVDAVAAVAAFGTEHEDVQAVKRALRTRAVDVVTKRHAVRP